ncbi:hypothetical protein [Sphingobacterium sp. JUb56]|uniref:hypothetical protein n=1 Tax=Sphingobacterium sp. JUb56 TaxID=2587145 RepID=UPI00161B0E25|nr:hypothetical protein [Sphingobacterium sp. JUb56]MBB2950163.1 hypothetical protein [Sphingobacterium sp. JUb56]
MKKIWFSSLSLILLMYSQNTMSQKMDSCETFMYGLWSSTEIGFLEKLSINKAGFFEIMQKGTGITKHFKITEIKDGLIKGEGYDYSTPDGNSGSFLFQIKRIDKDIMDFKVTGENKSRTMRLKKVGEFDSGIFFAK